MDSAVFPKEDLAIAQKALSVYVEGPKSLQAAGIIDKKQIEAVTTPEINYINNSLTLHTSGDLNELVGAKFICIFNRIPNSPVDPGCV